ncbi:MAG: hypothetical protein GX589_07610 [Deltaproteobacteria bacterium]|nr:hypothetical protein [Deltaproteobacteria bacterium]
MVAREEESSVLVNEGVVAQVMLNRPQALNAINADMLQSIIFAFERLQRDPGVRVITLWGAGKEAFIAGMDIPAVADLGPRPMAEYVELGQRAMRVIETCRVPVVAAVNGFAFGPGLEVALACDLIVAGQTARFGLPEAELGVVPAFGGLQRLLQRCGVGAVRRLAFTSDLIDVQEALRLGLVDIVAAEGELNQVVNALADKISKQAPLALTQVKNVLRRAEEQVLLAGLRREVESYLKLYESADRQEGMHAFMHKRPPDFKGR